MWSNQDGTGDQGGGGYMTSPGNFNSPQGSQQQKTNRQRAQSIVPCTISSLLKVEHVNDRFMLGSVELHQVTIVGLVKTVKQTATRMDYEIDDMTGPPINVRRFIDSDDNMEDPNQMIRENMYVRVSGNLRSFSGVRSVVVFKVVPIMDMMELTNHILESMKAHITLTKGGGDSKGMQGISNNATSMNQGGGYSGAVDPGLDGLTPTQKQVATAIKSVDSEQGVSVQEICQQLRGLPEKAIREAIDFLSGEGHIYSTIDDDHYRSTDAL